MLSILHRKGRQILCEHEEKNPCFHSRKRFRRTVPSSVLPELPSNPQNLGELIELAKSPCMYRDTQMLPFALPALMELQALIGLKRAKHEIFNFVKLQLQNTYFFPAAQYHHLKLVGPEGSGKTLLGAIVARIVVALSRRDRKIIRIKREDVIADTSESTKVKTQQMLSHTRDCVLIVDRIVNGQNLLEVQEFMRGIQSHMSSCTIIIIGTKLQLLLVNPTMLRMCRTCIVLEPYSSSELKAIIRRKLQSSGVTLPTKLRIPLRVSSTAADIGPLCNQIMKVHAQDTFGKLDKLTIRQKTIDSAVTNMSIYNPNNSQQHLLMYT